MKHPLVILSASALLISACAALGTATVVLTEAQKAACIAQEAANLAGDVAAKMGHPKAAADAAEVSRVLGYGCTWSLLQAPAVSPIIDGMARAMYYEMHGADSPPFDRLVHKVKECFWGMAEAGIKHLADPNSVYFLVSRAANADGKLYGMDKRMGAEIVEAALRVALDHPKP